jgi:release factor glutamine methyltransferase
VNAATLGAALLEARQQLMHSLGLEIDVAALEAHVLLGHVLSKPRAYLLAYPEIALTESALAQFAALLARRVRGEPIAYLTGQREFYELVFSVTPDVLIPRPETELLVELALERIPRHRSVRILELGTGSGAIAITLAKHRPQAQVIALDVSMRALKVAKANAVRLKTPNVSFVASDWFGALLGTSSFDVIVSNPPYIAENDPHLLAKDIQFEPPLALRAGPDGMDAIRHITPLAFSILTESGHLLFEHGYDQQQACAALLARLGYAKVACHSDLGGKARVSLGKKTHHGEKPCTIGD